MSKQPRTLDAISYTEARNSLATAMDQVCENHAPIIITRQNGSATVLMSLDDFRAVEETAFLLRSPSNAKRLAESIKQLESGKALPKKLRE